MGTWKELCDFVREHGIEPSPPKTDKSEEKMPITIIDDRKCKICKKKLTEHSSFYDNHKYTPMPNNKKQK